MSGDHKPYADVPMYSTGLFTSRIRVMGLTPESLPDVESWQRVDHATGDFQRLFFRDGRLVGGCLIGNIRAQSKIIQLIQARTVFPKSEWGGIIDSLLA